jgi:hypothetical protein
MDERQPMTGEELHAFMDVAMQETLYEMTPFQRFLHDNGLVDDVIKPELSPDDTLLEPADLCADSELGCAYCIGYWKRDGEVTFCTCEHHKSEKPREVPYDHCDDVGCDNCVGVVIENSVISHCTCEHHRAEIAGYIESAEG